MLKARTFLRGILLAGLCLLGLSACQTSSIFSNLNAPAAENIFGQALPQSAEYYLGRAQASSPPQKQKYQLLAANAYLQGGQTTQAQELIDNIRTTALPASLITQKQLLAARIELVQNNTQGALSTLNGMQANNALNTKDEVAFRQLMAAAYTRAGKYLPAVQERVALARHLSRQASKQNDRAIWSDLQNVSLDALTQFQDQGYTNHNQILAGWIELAYISKAYGNSTDALSSQLQSWRTQYPNHPANQFLPKDLSASAPLFNSARQGHVVMLLPLSGKYAKAGRAVRNGFLASYYGVNSRQPGSEDVKIYDTTKGNINALYEKALAGDASFVIGPIRKRKVDELLGSRSDFPVPTLALNYSTSSYASATNFFQFGLSPRDEAEQTAVRAWRDGRSRAIIIAPRGRWGASIADTFASTFQGQGGTVVQRFTYSNKQNLNRAIKDMLQVDDSAERLHEIEAATHRRMSFTPRRRDDMDMFFLVASPGKAQTIRPLLKFYYAGDVPVYATSSIYTGVPSRADKDLDGIIFCDIPFVLNNNKNVTETRRNLAHIWPNNYDHYVRLYALGMDAFTFSQDPERLTRLGQIPYQGESGALSMDSGGRIYRKLSFAKMQGSRPQRLGD